MTAYPRLFSEWQIRHDTIPNRIVFAPTCPTWVADPLEGIFTDQAVAYYEERARSGVGLIIIGGTIIHREALYSELNFRASGTMRRSRVWPPWPRRFSATARGSSSSFCTPDCGL